MAVFKQELNWSHYQNEQMKILQGIEDSFSKSLQIGQHLANNMNKIEYAITSIAYASESSAKNIAAFTKDLTGSAVEFTSRMDKASDITERFTFQLSESGKSVEESNKRMSSSGAKTASVFLDIAATAWEAIGGLRGIGREADKFSDASNQMIKLSGVSGDMVREFRSELMSIVSDLNLSTGSAFNPLESYKQIISISQGVTSDLEAIGEMARPLLLAQETLDVNINTIADLFNRFYVKYSFSSTHMEDTLNEIRGNTAGNSANAEATVENIQALENWINVIAKDDNAKREQMLEEISHYTSWIESMGGDSAAYTNYMKSIAYGDWNSNPELLHILNLAGSNATEAQNMFNSGDFGKLTELLFTGVGGVADKALSTSVSGRAFDNYGLDRDLGMSTKNILDSSNFTSFEDFLESVSGASPTMEQLTEDKYVSLADKTNNWLSLIYEKVAMMQEYLPLGLSDIASIIYLARGAGGANLGSLSNMIGSTGNAMVGGSGILGKLASGGYNLAGGAAANVGMSGGAAAGLGALGVAGVGAGIGMGLYGGVEAYKNFSSGETGLGVANTVGAVGGAVGAGALTASLLGAGAAAGPIGWAALAVGGIALVGAKAYEAAHAYEDAGKAVTTAYKDARASFLQEAAYRENYLEDIQVLLDDESNADEARRKLLQSGLLSEEEMQKLRKGSAASQIEAMKELTEAYLIAAGKFSDTTEDLLDKYEERDRDAATATAQSIKEWYDSHKNEKSDTNAAIMEDMVFAIEKQLSGKDNLSKDEQWFMDELNKNRSLGRTSQQDWEYLLDKGTNLSLLYNNVTGTNLENLVNKANKKGAGWTDYTSFTDPTMIQKYLTPIVVAATKEEAEEALKAAKAAGIKKDDYDEIAEAMSKFGIPEYARGTNYISRDQVAVVHEGEAIIPKKYNPAANPTDTRALAARMDRERLEMREYFINFVAELQEIKEFLSVWKEDNDKQSRINSAKSRTESTRSYIRSYMST